VSRRRRVGQDEQIELDYNGRTIVFREDEDDWSCHALKLAAKSLSALKRKIDKLDGEARRVSVPAVRLSRYSQGERVDVVLIAKPKDWERDWDDRHDAPLKPCVWVMRTNGNEQRRVKVGLGELAPVTRDTLLSLQEAKRLQAESKRLDEQADAVLAGIPRLTLDDLTAKGAAEEALDE
jgi:hypothetical protein